MSFRQLLIIPFVFAAFSLTCGAAVGAPCRTSDAVGQTCSIAVSSLHPTQLTVGMIEVKDRADKFASWSEKKRQTYLDENPIPLVIGPDGNFYATDHHHLALAFAQVEGRDAAVVGQIQQNWSTLPVDAFWQQMTVYNYLFLYDEVGAGPLPLSAMPADVFGLHDDPYRSLAWGVRKNGGYDDTTVPHADFLWANFFRPQIALKDIDKHFDDAVSTGTLLAKSPAARELPGYTGQ